MQAERTIKSLVLAEDDRDDHLIFTEAVNQIDPSVSLYTVTNGNELMDLLQHYHPDILFLDLDMPEKNGLECLKEIRSSEKLKNLPVIIFSSTSRPVNIETAYELGCDLFFVKPASYGKLLASLQKIFSFNWKHREMVKLQFLSGDQYSAFINS